ncbi:MAG: cell division protein FtsL [Succinivibrio sp.]
MQNSNALKISDDNQLQESFKSERDNAQRPQFGNRANPDVKPVLPQVETEYETKVEIEHIIHVDPPEVPFAGGMAALSNQSAALGYQGAHSQGMSLKPLIPTIFDDIFSNLLTYFLILVLACLAVFKVQQVQATRDMIIKYNEVKLENEVLHRNWLHLLATREELTEYSVIKTNASEKIGMVMPRTEDEVVIDLR